MPCACAPFGYERDAPCRKCTAMTDGLLRHFFCREVDPLNYVPTLARLRILDALPAPSERRRRIGSGSGIGWIVASPDVDRRERVHGCGATARAVVDRVGALERVSRA